MNPIEQKRLDNKVALHKRWLQNAHVGRRANFSHARMVDADLRKVDLRCAILTCASFGYADLRDADLRGADLRQAGFDRANLKGAKLDYQLQEGLGLRIATMLLEDPELLDMGVWDSPCGTRHCLAGWAVELNEVAKELQESHGYEIAGLLTLGYEWHNMFYKSTGEALEFLEGIVDNSSNNP